MNIIQALNWRYATKRMNGKQVSQEKVDIILESIRLSASAIGLQPYRVLVISDQELKAALRPIANNQAQVTESSHLLVFAAWDKVTNERVDAFIANIARTRNVSEDSLAAVRNYGTNLVAQTAEQNFNWTARQTYIALGTALVAAASLEVDASPMEGFNNQALDERLGLAELGLKSVALLGLGYRDEQNDWLAKLAKVRTPKEELFVLKS